MKHVQDRAITRHAGAEDATSMAPGDTILVEQTGTFTIELNDETLNYR
ncbi:MAG: hypothetical protein JKX70_06530, partial [Phycisphaerales bacterium]|nr:hypothetical protein [Phycisphaerales bacterium]